MTKSDKVIVENKVIIWNGVDFLFSFVNIRQFRIH